jgi:hypothetical protein
MSAEENMALAHRFLEARGRADLDAMEEMMAPDFLDHTLAPANGPIVRATSAKSPSMSAPTPASASLSRSW